MPIPILMPALSPTMEEGKLAKWHVKVGDRVKSGDIIAEIETDKATMEVEAVDEGRVGELVVEEGTEGVKVNAPIALLLAEGEGASALKAVAAKAGATKAPSPQPSPRKRGEGEQSAAKQIALAPEGGERRVRDVMIETSVQGRVFASPLARRLADTKGIDLKVLAGSGPGGRIVKRDIEAAKPGNVAARPPVAARGEAPAHAKLPAAPLGSYTEVPLDGMRKVIAKRMTESFRDVPHFPLTVDIEIDKLVALRKELNAKLDEAAKISINDMLIRATALALKKVPDANASYTEKAILKHHHADIAVAVAIPGGLITPIIFQAENKGMAEISAEMKDKAARAKERKLKPEEYQGGTFSLSNLGMMGIKSFASIINEPHGAILSIGAGEQRPVVKNGALAIATVMTVTITCDHRVVDGAIGAAFLSQFKKLIEDPVLMLL